MPLIHALQLATTWHDMPANHRDVLGRLEETPPVPGSLVVLPEMFDVGFTMDVGRATDRSAADTAAFVGDLARRTRCDVVAGFAERDAAGRAVNQAAWYRADGARAASFVKCHGFSPAGEHERYAQGDGPVIVDWAGLRVAPLICYDLRFPELFRAATKRGAEMFVVIANWPAARIEHWVALARARAIENLAYVVAVNRCGRDLHLSYPGQSLIVDPRGVVVARAGDGPEVLSAEVDAEVVRGWRRDFPALRDARFW